jgi:putative endonuclease
MFYVYILKSLKDGSRYVGTTTNVEKRLTEHNSGTAKYSSSKKPFELVWFCAFKDKEKAIKFERYLKQGSGFAFTNKHFL